MKEQSLGSWGEQVYLRAAHNFESHRIIKQKPGVVSHPGEIGAIHEFQFPE
jgi:hypothetical protein